MIAFSPALNPSLTPTSHKKKVCSFKSICCLALKKKKGKDKNLSAESKKIKNKQILKEFFSLFFIFLSKLKYLS